MTILARLAPVVFSALLASISAPLMAQVDYSGGEPWNQRAESGPDSEVPGWFYNLGITGMRAELVANEPKVLLVRHIFRNAPASGLVKVDDKIIGAGGQLFQNEHRNGYGMKVFGADGPVAELAEALEACQGKSGTGRLTLTLRRGQKTIDVDLNIGKKYGSYAATYPAKCPKSEKVLKELLEYISKQQTADGSFGDPVHNTFSDLALLASGEERYLPAVERNLRYLCKTIRTTDENDRKYGLMNWTYTGTAIVLSEYYLATKNAWVLPELQKIHDLLEAGQYLDMSQINPKVKQTHPDDYPKGPADSHGGWGHNPGFEGYGPIAMITAQGALSYSLMERCGIKPQRARLDAAYAFLKRATAPNGYLWYGDKLGGGPDDWADMGRTGAAGIANFLSPYRDGGYRKQALLHSRVIGEHPQSFPDTHGSPVMGMAYAALAANIEPANFRKLMDANRWWFTMAQCADGTFYYQPNRDNAGYGSDARMTASCVVAFIFTISKRSLVITGKAVPPGICEEKRSVPNIVLILIDDQGYGDFSCHGNPVLKTPNMDRLHDEGVRFSDFHVSPTCSPTRCALMTGRHEFKSGVTHTILERERMSLKATTLAQALRTSGYATGIFGKWHLGDEPDHWPDKRGFDEMFIHGAGGIGQSYPGSCGDAPGNTYFSPAILHNGRFEKTDGYCTDVFFRQAARWMDSVKGQQPFFCYLATNAPHAPLQVRPEDERRYTGKVGPNVAKFFGMLANIDDNVGRLLARLDEWGIARETLVILMNDNGGTVGVPVWNAGMRGQKGTPWQGGTRAASFWRWPGTLKPADVDRLAAHIDVFPTLAELAGAKVPPQVAEKLDGRSLVPLLQNPAAAWPDRYVFTHVGRWPKGQAAASKYRQCRVRNQRYSLICDTRDGLKRWELYDLKTDCGEKRDIAGEYPEIVKHLEAAYDAWWEEVLPCMENENAVGPVVNPFKELYRKQFGKEMNR